MIKIKNKIKQVRVDRLVSITSVKTETGNNLYYHFSWDNKPEIKQITIEIPKNEQAESIVDIFKNAALLEAEITELFGIKFAGNEFSGKRLFQAETGGKKCTPPFIQ